MSKNAIFSFLNFCFSFDIQAGTEGLALQHLFSSLFRFCASLHLIKDVKLSRNWGSFKLPLYRQQLKRQVLKKHLVGALYALTEPMTVSKIFTHCFKRGSLATL